MRLRTRLLFILLAVILTGSLFTFVFFRIAARGLFQTYVFSGDREKARLYSTLLGEYYLEKKSWNEVQSFIADLPRMALREMDRRIHGENEGGRFFSPEDLRALITERIVLADADGIIVADTTKTLLGTHHPGRHLSGGTEVIAGSRRVGTVLVGSMIDSSLTEPAENFLAAMTRAFLAAALISGFIAFLLGLLFTLGITRTLGALSAAAKGIGRGAFSVRISAAGDDELAELAESFNQMALELRGLEEAKRRIIADSAHELRTPLTLIQGTLEGMMDGVLPFDRPMLESVHEETLRLSRLIDTLRELEIIESGRFELHLEPLRAADLAQRAEQLFAKAARDKEIALSVSVPERPEPPIRGDYLRLGQVLDNLTANALRHTPRGGRIRIAVGEAESGGLVAISVEDSGPGIPAGEREKIFERFYRIDRSRSADSGGRGLGLSIAREIVRAHGGTIAAGASESLGGARFRVELPAADSAG